MWEQLASDDLPAMYDNVNVYYVMLWALGPTALLV